MAGWAPLLNVQAFTYFEIASLEIKAPVYTIL